MATGQLLYAPTTDWETSSIWVKISLTMQEALQKWISLNYLHLVFCITVILTIKTNNGILSSTVHFACIIFRIPTLKPRFSPPDPSQFYVPAAIYRGHVSAVL